MKSFTFASLFAAAIAKRTNPDAFKTMEQICQEHGYATESVTLQTDDGYILSLYRIPGTFEEIQEGMPKKPVVLMMHAQDCDMMEWVWNDYDRSNAFILARAGYDVWMGNNRGSKYSNTHISYTTDDLEYWDFYQEDMGLKDSPTFIDYILNKTGQETLSYVGHSEGTTQFFMGASLNPEYYAEKVNLFIALAPVGTTANIPTWFIRDAAKFIDFLEWVLIDVFHYYNWFAPMPIAVEGVVLLCDILPFVCSGLAKLLHHDGVDNSDRFDVLISNEPSG